MSLTYLENRHNIHDSPWSDELIARLKVLWAEGLSAAQIAAELNGAKFTRMSVIGKAHRLKLPAREERKTGPRKPRARHTPRPVKWRPPQPKPPPPPPPVAPRMRSLTIFKLRPQHCRWPLWDDNAHGGKFCAADAAGQVYCPFHMGKARA